MTPANSKPGDEHEQLRDQVKVEPGVVDAAESSGSGERRRVEPAPGVAFGGILGECDAMRELFDIVSRIAPSLASVLITGESGVGKELVARAIHERSRHRTGAMVTANCAALPVSLVESELFGHARGAFTSAQRDHAGLFSAANGGTLFLDEVGELPLAVQPKLLRALQERVVRPVGSNVEVKINVRVVSATNIDLERMVAARRFRADLYFRLNVVHIAVPPLRERDDDVMLLARHFLRVFAARESKSVRDFSDGAVRRLRAHTWPGNVRELQNCVERAVTLARAEQVEEGDLLLMDDGRERGGAFRRTLPPPREATASFATLNQVERAHVEHVLQALHGNKARAARALGMSRKTLYRKLRGYRGDTAEQESDPPDSERPG